MKENLKQFIFRKLEGGEYILDKDIAQFSDKNGDIPFYQAEVYKREYSTLENQKNEFDGREDKTISSYKNSYKNAKTKYYLEYKGIGENRHQPITKAYFNYLLNKGIKKLN